MQKTRIKVGLEYAVATSTSRYSRNRSVRAVVLDKNYSGMDGRGRPFAGRVLVRVQETGPGNSNYYSKNDEVAVDVRAVVAPWLTWKAEQDEKIADETVERNVREFRQSRLDAISTSLNDIGFSGSSTYTHNLRDEDFHASNVWHDDGTFTVQTAAMEKLLSLIPSNTHISDVLDDLLTEKSDSEATSDTDFFGES